MTQTQTLPQTTEPKAADKPKFGFWWGTGRRKSAIARVRVRPGSGKFLINDREVDNYFSEIQHRTDAQAPLTATNTAGKIDVFVSVSGGGITGQAGAILLGLARALSSYDPTLEQTFRDNGYMTRDAREVERKKYGQAGARRRFQFSKR
ncbi:MAG: 30S ribosomal protein S9 [Planctomycetes bacterium]|nr:30S ribosomal protein S9 [Planctomycetota bacterium]